nr:nucleolar protein 6-like [Procambarus clarkii]
MKSKMTDFGSGEDSGNEVSSSEENMMSGSDTSEKGGDESDSEDECDDGFSDEEEKTGQNSKRKHPNQGGKQVKSAKVERKKESLYRLPTMDELNTLRETQLLYHSNLFRMQMEELLAEVSMKDKHRQQLDQWFAQFSAYLKAMPASSEYQLGQTKWMDEKGICDPLAKDMPEARGTFLFAAPTSVQFVGSLASGTITTQNSSVDVMITLPKECVHAADWQNGRWLVKRIRYLAWIAADLQDKTDLVANLNWTTHLGSSVRPVLQITPSGKIGQKWKVNLFPVPPPESFKVRRFSPERSNLQPRWFFSEEAKVEENPSTPHYNWACAVDVVMLEHFHLVRDCVSQHTNLMQGIKLIKIWLAQRDLDKGVGSFSGHMVTLLVVHLLQARKIKPQMSAYQVFRDVVVALSSENWCESGPNMCTSPPIDGPTPETFHKLYEVVFIDPSGRVNLAAKFIMADYLRIKHEAQLALSFLDSSASDSFESLFIKKVEIIQLSDQVLRIRFDKAHAKTLLCTRTNYQELLMDTLGDMHRLALSSILQMLREGLGERAELLVPMREPQSMWLVEQPPPQLDENLVVGLVLNPVSAWALLTKGPPADDPKAENFKTFWGSKCSLRRFQDGSFHEAVLWGTPDQSMGKRRLIPGKICRYILNLHCMTSKKCVYYIANQLERSLHHPHYMLKYNYATGEEATVSAIQAFDSLSRKLRSLDLPLKIAAVQPTSDVSRHARVFPPVAKAVKPTGKAVEARDNHLQFSENGGNWQTFNYAMEVNVFLEISGKWPDDLQAIQAIKAEFHSKMSDLLQQDSITTVVFPKYLQILWEGYVFRVRVCYLREIYVQRLVETPEGDWREQDTAAAIQLEKQIEIIPRFTTALASIQADYPSFSGGVRLCKRWLGSQLLLPHLPHTAVELLVAYLFLNAAPYAPPSTPHVTLLRFLQLLALTDWKVTPILVNLNEAFTVDDVAELNRRFLSQRSTLPHMFIVSPYELRSVSSTETSADLDHRYKLASMWTKTFPSVQILYRSKQLAEAALGYLDNNLLKGFLNFKMIFLPSSDDYDVVIHLNSKHLCRHEESIRNSSFIPKNIKPYEYHSSEIMPIVMFDAPFLYLKELRDTYNHVALFFYDEHGGKFIGVVWKPQALVLQELKVGGLEGHQLVGVKEVKQVANIEAILDDFQTLGADLVKKVTVKNK